MPHKIKSHEGERFGKLVVIERAPDFIQPSTGRPIIKWRCQCDCGKLTDTYGYSLRNGTTKSCGCLIRETSVTHDLRSHELYGTWAQMNARCFNPKNGKYKDYGGRGIKVCERWRDVRNFISDMPPRPSKLHTIDRVNNDGDYESSNVRWATRKEQQNNTRLNHKITFGLRTLNLTQWEKELNLASRVLHQRVRKSHCTFEQAIEHFHNRKIQQQRDFYKSLAIP